ncbi:MAG: hypothetical protein L0027_12945, partial [Candidatus Rokubacteria bacterium]|nr:hypothetical protein [Candidatus Rokubacteria bacterium]
MPVSKDLAREVIRRLTQYGSLDVLARRLAPIPPEEKPLPPDVPRPSDWSEEARAQRIEFLEAQGVELPWLAERTSGHDPETLRG